MIPEAAGLSANFFFQGTNFHPSTVLYRYSRYLDSSDKPWLCQLERRSSWCFRVCSLYGLLTLRSTNHSAVLSHPFSPCELTGWLSTRSDSDDEVRLGRPVTIACGALQASYYLSFSYCKENNMYFRLIERLCV